jgi:hypothetical protein
MYSSCFSLRGERDLQDNWEQDLLATRYPRIYSVLFWKDNWEQDLLPTRYPRIYSYALDTDVSLKTVFDSTDITSLAKKFATPVSVQPSRNLLK